MNALILVIFIVAYLLSHSVLIYFEVFANELEIADKVWLFIAAVPNLLLTAAYLILLIIWYFSHHFVMKGIISTSLYFGEKVVKKVSVTTRNIKAVLKHM